MTRKKILFLMSGSIACYKAAQVISRLAQDQNEVQMVVTPSTFEFIGAATLEGLSGKKVLSDMYEPNQMMKHIHLMRWADLIVLAPATANTLAEMATGLAGNMVTALSLAHDFKKPFLIFPAMNDSMYLHPATQNNILKLKNMNYQIFGTAEGSLACGETGQGRLIEPEEILSQIKFHLNQTSPNPKGALVRHTSAMRQTDERTVLITAGGTREKIDDVRFITNMSSGKTGVALAEQFRSQGFKVALLLAESSALTAPGITTHRFDSFADLQSLLKNEIRNNSYDTVIHLAAVSDYSVDTTTGKISSDQLNVQLNLKKNPKLVNEIKSWSLNKDVKLVAFKLTSTNSESEKFSKILKLLTSSKADYIVHNDVSEITEDLHTFHIYKSEAFGADKISTVLSTQALATQLIQNLKSDQKFEKELVL